MGINAEMIKLSADLRLSGRASGDSVIELGAQVVCVDKDVAVRILNDHDFYSANQGELTPQNLYKALGFTNYNCIDATGENDSLVFDLNNDIQAQYSFERTFDLVTNLGTTEHCFDQRNVFKNIHNLCKRGGLMIHAAPSQGNVNHAFYNYHPRFFIDLATANNYDVLDIYFTVDYKPELIPYSISNYKKWDSHDVLLYVVLQKNTDRPFALPFDGMFSSMNKLNGYLDTEVNPFSTEFSPYLKGGNWENTKGRNAYGNLSSKYRSITSFLQNILKA